MNTKLLVLRHVHLLIQGQSYEPKSRFALVSESKKRWHLEYPLVDLLLGFKIESKLEDWFLIRNIHVKAQET